MNLNLNNNQNNQISTNSQQMNEKIDSESSWPDPGTPISQPKFVNSSKNNNGKEEIESKNSKFSSDSNRDIPVNQIRTPLNSNIWNCKSTCK